MFCILVEVFAPGAGAQPSKVALIVRRTIPWAGQTIGSEKLMKAGNLCARAKSRVREVQKLLCVGPGKGSAGGRRSNCPACKLLGSTREFIQHPSETSGVPRPYHQVYDGEYDDCLVAAPFGISEPCPQERSQVTCPRHDADLHGRICRLLPHNIGQVDDQICREPACWPMSKNAEDRIGPKVALRRAVLKLNI